MTKHKKQPILEPKEAEIKKSTYQPSKAEYEEEYNMLGMNDQQIKSAFFRPFKVGKNQ